MDSRYHANVALKPPVFRRERTMDNGNKNTQTWPELAIGLYEQLTGRGAEIAYEMYDLEVFVPSGTGSSAEQAKWKVNGLIKIRTRDQAEA